MSLLEEFGPAPAVSQLIRYTGSTPPIGHAMPSDSAAVDASISAILSGAADILRALLAQLSTSAGEPAPSAAFGNLFWREWCRHSALHTDFVAQLEPLQKALTALEPADWVAADAHPLWPLLELVRQAGTGYQPELARAGEKILADWAAVLQPLAAADWVTALQRAQTQWQQEQQKLTRLEQRLIDSERGQLRSRRAQLQAARDLNRAMGGNHFSAAVSAFLQDDWYRELQWCQLQFGEGSQQWRQRAALTLRLIASLQDPGGDSEARQRLYALIPEVEAELRTVLMERAHDAPSVDRQLALIEAHHVALLRSQPLRTHPFTPIASDDPWSSSAMSLSRDLLRRAAELTVGSSYRVRDGSGENRVKLVLKMDDTAQLLFVNRLGVKALQKSFEEFAYWLAADIAQALPDPADSPAVLRQLLRQLLLQDEQQAHAQAELRQREESDEQRRRAAREKAMAEASALAEVQAHRAREAEEKAREREQLRRRDQATDEYRGDDSQRLRQARQTAVTLSIGNWVEFYDDFGTAQRLRLAVKLSASGKLIFVDREGIRRAEYEREIFTALLLDGSARILDQGPQFEDTLARVVDSLRRDRVDRE